MYEMINASEANALVDKNRKKVLDTLICDVANDPLFLLGIRLKIEGAANLGFHFVRVDVPVLHDKESGDPLYKLVEEYLGLYGFVVKEHSGDEKRLTLEIVWPRTH